MEMPRLGSGDLDPHLAGPVGISVFGTIRDQLVDQEGDRYCGIGGGIDVRRGRKVDAATRHCFPEIGTYVAEIGSKIDRVDFIAAVQALMRARDRGDAARCIAQLRAGLPDSELSSSEDAACWQRSADCY